MLSYDINKSVTQRHLEFDFTLTVKSHRILRYYEQNSYSQLFC